MNGRFESEYEITRELISLLRKKGYNPATFRNEWHQDGQIFDLAIIDTQTTELLALFEIKLQSAVIVTSHDLRASLEKYANIATKHDVPLYLVSATEGKSNFSINLVTPQTRQSELPIIVDISTEQFPSFDELRSKIISEKRRETLDAFSKISYFFSFLTGLLLIVDLVGLISMTPSRLALLGVSIGLILLPKANRLKILGFEFERLKDTESK